jgi:hypothetical protein
MVSPNHEDSIAIFHHFEPDTELCPTSEEKSALGSPQRLIHVAKVLLPYIDRCREMDTGPSLTVQQTGGAIGTDIGAPCPT